MAEKQQPGGFVPQNGSYPSAPPSYQQAYGAQYPDPNIGQMAPSYSVPYPTASGAPPYYQQVQQGMAPYPNHSQQPQAPINAGYPYPGGPMPNAPMGSHQPPVGYAPYPKGPVASPYPQSAAPPVGGQFDAGARFTPYAPASVPPPPPGYAPNAAQMAAAQGHTVVTSQKQGGFFKGSGSGGYTFW